MWGWRRSRRRTTRRIETRMFRNRSQRGAALETDGCRGGRNRLRMICAVHGRSCVPERWRWRCRRRRIGRHRHWLVMMLVLIVMTVILRRFTITVFVKLMMILIGQMMMVWHSRSCCSAPSARSSRRNVTEIRRTHPWVCDRVEKQKNWTHWSKLKFFFETTTNKNG